MLNLDTKVYSPHSFRRGGATFEFQVGAHPLFIKCLGDWSSDAYLIYLTLSNEDKVETFIFFLFKDVEKKNGAKEPQTPHPKGS